MDAILGIDLQTRVVAAFVTQNFINASRAKALFRGIIFRQIDCDRCRRILQLQVARLIFLMIGAGEKDRGKSVKTQHAIWFGIGDQRTFAGQLQFGVVWRSVVQGLRGFAAKDQLIDPEHD